MKKYLFIFLGLSILIFTIYIFSWTKETKSDVLSWNHQVTQISIDPISSNPAPINVEATKLPEFVYSITDHKFDDLINAAAESLKDLVKVSIVHTAYAKTILNPDIRIDKEKRQLIIRPEDAPNFQPGLYRISLKLRTLEGEVNLNQDFAWGVIAVNTDKSIYEPGETAKIGVAVLNDSGQTLCLTGPDKVDKLIIIITDPQGNQTQLSSDDKSITDSGQCGPQTVTDLPDFQAKFITNENGIYQIYVVAAIGNQQREIKDYFKVEANVPFIVERISFPTRIYPLTPYFVTFKVTAKNNYKGKVAETVPSSFSIDHVSGTNIVMKDGYITHIYWDVNLIAGQSQNFTYFIQFPRISPEFYLLGPISIGNFTEARQWQIASDAINSSTGVFTCEDNASAHTWYRNWTGQDWDPPLATPTPYSMSTTPQDSRWFREASNPQTGEKLVALIDNNNDGNRILYVFQWSGSAWSLGQTIDPTTNWSTADTRYFDIAYEQQSGSALLVFYDPDNANRISYKRRIGTTWDSSISVVGTSTTPKSWIRLVPRINSDTILLSYVNTSNYIGAMLWNGNADTFGSEIVDNAGTAASGHITETVSSAWETQSGIPMVMWGNGSTSITYRRYTNSAWTAESTTGLTGYATNVYWVNAASDDTSSSNNIALGTSNSGATPNCDFAVWNGTTWSKGSSIGCRYQTANDDSVTNNRPINVAFEHNTGKAIFVYNTSAAPTFLYYRTWDSTNGFGASTTTGGTAQTNPISIQMYSDTNTVSIIVIYSMGTQASTTIAVYDREWNGSTWTNTPANPLFPNVQNGYEHTEAFGYGFDLNLELLAAYRFYNNSNDTIAGTPLTAQDIPYLFTVSNPKFRLRLLLYYSDSLAQNGRNYDLQFVDPGTGSCSNPTGGNPASWTTVGTTDLGTPATYITYYNNPGPVTGATVQDNAQEISYGGHSNIDQTYNEQNTFTDAAAAMAGGQNGKYDFSLIDNTALSITPHTFCFQVIRHNGTLIKINNYPQITTNSLSDVQIRGGSLIRGNTKLR